MVEKNDDSSIDIVLGNVLRWGTIFAAAVIALGGLAYLAEDGHDTPHYQTFRAEPAELTSVAGIVRDAMHLEAAGVIQLGLLLLVATPIARVIAALVEFAIRRDLMYVIISALVLAALAYGLLAS